MVALSFMLTPLFLSVFVLGLVDGHCFIPDLVDTFPQRLKPLDLAVLYGRAEAFPAKM